MAIKGNKGEWSEAYVLLKILSDRKLYVAADENLTYNEDIYFPVLKVIRTENNQKYEYSITEGDMITITDNLRNSKQLSITDFESNANTLYEYIKSANGRSFEFTDIGNFLNSIDIYSLKVKSIDKADIVLKLHDIYTGFEPIVGFSIKSYIGSKPTLLNPSGTATNLAYEAKNISLDKIDIINRVDNTKGKITKIYELGGELIFNDFIDSRFGENLRMIDSRMGEILAAMPLSFFLGHSASKKCSDMLGYLADLNPLGISGENERLLGFYEHKVKEFLCAVALGMTAVKPWSGLDDANGGYIVAKKNGDIVTYYIYQRNNLKNYLLNNTKFDDPSRARHLYGSAYEKDGKVFFDLAIQIRFT